MMLIIVNLKGHYSIKKINISIHVHVQVVVCSHIWQMWLFLKKLFCILDCLASSMCSMISSCKPHTESTRSTHSVLGGQAERNLKCYCHTSMLGHFLVKH